MSALHIASAAERAQWRCGNGFHIAMTTSVNGEWSCSACGWCGRAFRWTQAEVDQAR